MKQQRYIRRLNTLHNKLFISIFIAAIIPLALYMTLNGTLAFKKYNELEANSMTLKALQAERLLDNEVYNMGILLKDYATWDEAYKSVYEKDTNWFSINYLEWLPKYNDIDVIVVANTKKEIISSYGIERNQVTQLLNDKNISAMLFNEPNNEKDYFSAGFKIFNGDLYMVAASPMLKRDFSGPQSGVVVFARKVNSDVVDSVGNGFGINTIIKYNDKTISGLETQRLIEEYGDRINDISKQNYLKIEKDLKLAGAPIFDMSREKIGDIYIINTKTTMSSTIDVIRNNGRIVGIMSVLLIIIISIYYRNKLIKPIFDLENQINRMGENTTLGHVEVTGPEEIENLANTFNKMASSLLKHKAENENLKKLSITDGLTSLYNHRYFFEYFNQCISEKNRQISVIFFDIDQFKMVNSYFGHVVGDAVLVEISKIIKEKLNEEEGIFRYGGEEFAAVLNGINTAQAYSLAEEIRLRIMKSNKLQSYSTVFPITVSIGVSAYPKDGLNPEDIVEKADRAMIYSKQKGRNLTTIYNMEIDNILNESHLEFANQEMLLDAVFALTAAIDAKDSYTEKHSESVARYSLLMAEKMNLSQNDKYILRIGGILHDCGKIGIPDEIIHKPGKFDDNEWKIVKNHTLLGSSIAKHVAKFPEIITCIRNHHERWDGNGYPDGLAGYDIPFHARIVCIADSYHAMVSDRPYRRALTKKEAFEELTKNKGTQFDPELVDVFIDAVKNRG